MTMVIPIVLVPFLCTACALDVWRCTWQLERLLHYCRQYLVRRYALYLRADVVEIIFGRDIQSKLELHCSLLIILAKLFTRLWSNNIR